MMGDRSGRLNLDQIARVHRLARTPPSVDGIQNDSARRVDVHSAYDEALRIGEDEAVRELERLRAGVGRYRQKLEPGRRTGGGDAGNLPFRGRERGALAHGRRSRHGHALLGVTGHV